MRKNGGVLAIAVVLVIALAGCQTPWRTGRFDTRSSGFNPSETTISRDNVGSLALQASAELPQRTMAWGQPIVDRGSVYVSGQHELLVYSADATAGCAGVPRTCAPVWTASVGAAFLFATPTIADGKVYVVATDAADVAIGTVHVYDAAGQVGCAGVPKVCTPLWTAPVGDHAAVTVSDHRAFVVDRMNRLAVLDADGVTGCSGSPTVCQPLWTTLPVTSAGRFFEFEAPTVGGGVVVIMDNNGGLFAYDATGAANCSGEPLVCSPLWYALGYQYATNDNTTNLAWTAPVIVGDRVIGYRSGPELTTRVSAFDLHGVEGCSGVPNLCAPVWSTLVTGLAVDAEVTAAYGSVFVMTEGSSPNLGSHLTAIADDGSGCTGTPMVCPVQWQHDIPVGSPTAVRHAAPIAANGLLYLPTYDGFRVFDARPLSPGAGSPAAGTCVAPPAGLPLSCQPVATITGPTADRNAAISDGRLYEIESVSVNGSITSSALKIYGL